MLMELRRDNLPVLLANAADAEKDKDGSSSSSLAGTLRFLGVAEYVVNGDRDAFRSYLTGSAALRNEMLDRYLNGDAIDGSYVTMILYKDILTALAANDFGLARSIASKAGGRHELEMKYDHTFDLAFGYALKAVVENDELGMKRWCKQLLDECSDEANSDLQFYAEALDAIRRSSSFDVSIALKEISSRHTNQAKVGGIFKDTEDETLCVWGIALANLAINCGLSIDVASSFIPQDLVG